MLQRKSQKQVLTVWQFLDLDLADVNCVDRERAACDWSVSNYDIDTVASWFDWRKLGSESFWYLLDRAWYGLTFGVIDSDNRLFTSSNQFERYFSANWGI